MSFTDPLKAKTFIQGYFRDAPEVLRALDWVVNYHNGVRKDNKTPEWFHQVSILMYLMTLEKAIDCQSFNTNVGYGDSYDPINTLYVTTLFHDSKEDKGLPIWSLIRDYGTAVGNEVELLSKKAPGEPTKSKADYYYHIGRSPIASIVKGADRIHNVQTMPGVFDVPKMESYLKETETYVLPMLRVARKRFPENRAVYENLKHMLLSQTALISFFLNEASS